MMKNLFVVVVAAMMVIAIIGYGVYRLRGFYSVSQQSTMTEQMLNEPLLSTSQQVATVVHELQIEQQRQKVYPGSEITIVETLDPGSNYDRYLASYESEGNTIYALLTVPQGEKPVSGWPVIIFNHGYIPPEQYRTTERYQAYVDALARNGYIVFRSDYRGHGNSEGQASGAYGSPGYTTDVLNAVSSMAQFASADPDRIGMWGHSMGGYITLRSMVINPNIKAGVIWGGVVASYSDLIHNWRRRATTFSPPPLASGARRWRDALQETYGTPEANPVFWDSISANAFLNDLSGPVALHHARGDQSVPWEFSQTLADQMSAVNQPYELFLYEGDDHDISSNFDIAMDRTVTFFDQHLKGEYGF